MQEEYQRKILQQALKGREAQHFYSNLWKEFYETALEILFKEWSQEDYRADFSRWEEIYHMKKALDLINKVITSAIADGLTAQKMIGGEEHGR